MDDTTKDFVASVYIVSEGKVLLVHHKKMGMWLPVGGHIEKDELPTECAVREAKEEAGVDIVVIGKEKNYDDKVWVMAHPKAVQLEDIEPGHQHIDLVYFARLKDKSQQLKNDDEGIDEVKWFSKEELNDVPPLVKIQAMKALEEVR